MAGSLAFLSAIEIWRCHPVDVDGDDDDDEENNVMEHMTCKSKLLIQLKLTSLCQEESLDCWAVTGSLKATLPVTASLYLAGTGSRWPGLDLEWLVHCHLLVLSLAPACGIVAESITFSVNAGHAVYLVVCTKIDGYHIYSVFS